MTGSPGAMEGLPSRGAVIVHVKVLRSRRHPPFERCAQGRSLASLPALGARVDLRALGLRKRKRNRVASEQPTVSYVWD